MKTETELTQAGPLSGFSIGDGHTVEDLCASLAKTLGVRQHEVALLHLERRMLRFLHPVELRAAGSIPLSSTAVAARTANVKRPEIFNNFVQVQHSSIFESIKIGSSDGPADPLTIQKMMSVPVMGPDGSLLGVLQVSRKGYDLRNCGPDFTATELGTLMDAAVTIGRLLPHLLGK